MKKISIAVITSLICAFLLGSVVSADGPIIASEDVFVDLNDPGGLIYGSSDGLNLYADFTNNDGSYTFALRNYLKFPISSLTGPVAIGTRLLLYVVTPPTSAFNVSLWSTTDDWSEDTVTWNSGPVVSEKLDTQVTPLTSGAWITFSSPALINYINTELDSDDVIASFIVQFESSASPKPFDIIEFQDSEGASNQPYLEIEIPTGFDVAGFSAIPQMGIIQIQWNTGNETDLQGFNLYRSLTEDGVREMLNPALIDAKYSGTILGALYTFDDPNVQGGTTYFYWLEMDGFSDTEFLKDPVIAAANHVVYLPVARKSDTPLRSFSWWIIK